VLHRPVELAAKSGRKQVQQLTRLFDHFIGGPEQVVRHDEAENTRTNLIWVNFAVALCDRLSARFGP
jgi:hypothetical protein